MLISTIAEGYLKPDTPEYDEILQSINQSTKETYSLLENLLQWTRAQTGDLDWSPERLDIEQLAGNAFRFMGPNALKKKITLEKDIEYGLSLTADPLMMQSVIQNLLGNAIKFTREGGKVRFTAEYAQKEVILRVSDNGIGMKPEQLKKLFVEGQHMTTRGTNSEKGSGLGLLLVKEFVQRNKGRIDVESQEGEGTTFILHFPAGNQA